MFGFNLLETFAGFFTGSKDPKRSEVSRSDNALDIAVDLIKEFEGFNSNDYKCPAGIPTFGYGSLVAKYPNIKFPVSKEAATECLLHDCHSIVNRLDKLVTISLNPNQLAALISFCYNLGCGAFQRSTLRSKLNRCEYEAAANEFLRWNKATVDGVLTVLPGLARRREAERVLFLEDFNNGEKRV